MKHTRLLLLGLIVLIILAGFKPFLSIVEEFRARVSGYYHEKIGSTLFLHTDKSIYIPNESIWFKAYLLDSSPLQHEVLYLRLLNDQNKIVLQSQFIVYDIRSNGDMLLPVTIAPGTYRLIAYTDKMISFNPDNVFVQQIQVIKDQSSEMKLEASVADSADFSVGKIPKIIVKLSVNDRRIEKAKGVYKIYTSDKKIIAEGKFLTGPGGDATLNFTYPVTAENEDLFLQCNVADKDQSKELNIRLPKTTTTILTHCYPEGGHLVNGLSNRVLITVTDVNGYPLSAKVALKTKTKQIVTTTTNINGYSLISFTPDIKENYSLEINTTKHFQTIAFPVKIDPAGYTIQLKGSPDTPSIMVKNKNMNGNIVLLGRTLSELKFSKKLALKSGDSILVTLPKNDSINHIIDLGLFNSDNKLLAERMIYLPIPEKYHVTFQLDKTSYTSREKVRGNIKITDLNGNDISANLSVAVVAKQTINPLVEKRITETDLNALRQYPTNRKDIKDLNNRLIKEHFKVGDWTAVMAYHPKGQIEAFSHASGVFGSVISKKKKKIDLKTLFFFGKSGIKTIPVDPTGNFYIPAKDLISQNGKSNYLVVNQEFNNKYDLQIKDYSGDFDTKLVLTTSSETLPLCDLIKRSDQLISITSGRILREVVIEGKKSTNVSSADFNVTDYHSMNCNDYVCFYNILNCKNHPEGGPSPTEGQIYVLNGRPIRYHGCASNNPPKDNTYKVKNIDFPRNFHLPNYTKEAISAPELQSTIFWEPNLNTLANGKALIEFYTSDIKGEFTIIVQGLTVNGLVPIYGKSNFRVTQKK